ncbi:DEAD/DEAH box helicase [Thermincola ferriacetica]
MKNMSLTDSEIRNYARSSSVYLRGYTYYVENRVKGLRFDVEDLAVYATVLGKEPYDVEITLSPEGDLYSCWCDCPAFAGYDGICKHIVAVLIAFQRNLRKNGLIIPKADKETALEIINLFSSLDRQRKKEEVNFEIMLQIMDLSYTLKASAEFRIGLQRLYVMKNIKEFLEKINEGKPVEFGKNFIFEPELHAFKPADRPVIDFLLEVLALEKASDMYDYYSSNSVFRGKTLVLNDLYLKKFLDVLGDRPFKFCFLPGSVLSDMTVCQGLPLNFKVERSGDGLALILDTKETPISLTSGGEYFYWQNRIFRASDEQRKYFFPLLKKYLGSYKKITFPAPLVEPFVSEVLPCIRKTGQVHVDPVLRENICHEELIAKIYFDRNIENPEGQTGIAARLELHYGDRVINPFSSGPVKGGEPADKKIIVRDSRKEQKIFDLLEQAGFTVCQGEIHLFDDEKIFNFIENILPQLRSLAEIYYSEDFKSLRIRATAPFSGRVRLDEKLNLLEFSLQFDDINSDELEQVLNSIKMKKQYFRLRDGSFLDLRQPELKTVATMIEQLGLDTRDLGKKVINLPKYRALYIDSFLRHKNLHGISRNSAFKHLVQSIREPQHTDFRVPEELQNVLREYQKTGFKWLKTLASYGLGGILADDMGLGKTLQVIAFILSEKGAGQPPALVIAPTSLVYNWYEEVKKFAPSLRVEVVTGGPAERQEKLKKLAEADIVVTSYPLIRRDIEHYRQFEFAYCFLDEAQHIKNPNTINARSVQQINARSYFALTGTPIENSLTELWSIFNFIMPGYLLSHKEFQRKYEIPAIKGDDPGILEELSRHVQPFILRRLKRDVLKELPEKIETRLTAEMTREQEKIYLAYLKQAQGEIMREIGTVGFKKSRMKILAALTRLRQICCHPGLFIENYTGDSGKMQLLQELIEDALASGHRILLFSQFTSMLGILRDYLVSQNIEYHYLDGNTKAEQRQEMVHAFNAGDGQVFLISLKAGGTGLNLTGADMVIHYDPWWNPAVEEQATDRAYRIGQQQVVQVFKLVTRGTIEEKIFTLQQKKKELIDSVIQPGETFLSRLTEEELRAIFEI